MPEIDVTLLLDDIYADVTLPEIRARLDLVGCVIRCLLY